MATVAAAGASTSRERAVKLSGLVCLAAGVLGACSGIMLAVWPTEGADDTWRYPLSSEGFAAIQVWFAIQHLGLLAGIVAILRAGVVGAGRAGRVGVGVGAAGMALLTATELLAVTARDADLNEYGYLNALYGISSILTGVGLIVAGVAVRRARIWSGWRNWIVLIAGIWVFVPMFPAMVAGFVPARLGITGWMLTFAALGWALWRAEDSRGHG